MSLSLTYPGIYIQELPGPPPTIAAAPTSVTVFIGYTNPLQSFMPDGTPLFGQATQIGSFNDYQRLFGGLYANQWVPADVAYAVQQFFLNGGSSAYVVAIQPNSLTIPEVVNGVPVLEANGNPVQVPFFNFTPAIPPPAVLPGQLPALGTPPQGGPSGILSIPAAAPGGNATPLLTVSGIQLVDNVHTMTLVATNFVSSNADGHFDMADIIISYDTAVETFRRVSVYRTSPPNSQTPNANFIETRINGNSNLIWVSPPPNATAYPFFETGQPAKAPSIPLTCDVQYAVTPGLTATVQPGADFVTSTGPFVENSSLDKVSIFNLMVIPNVYDPGVLSQAIAFCERKRAFLIMDPPPNYSADGMAPGTTSIVDYVGLYPISINAALYFPWVLSTDPLNPTNTSFQLPPSGTVAGIFAATDSNRGVWKAPAGFATILNNVTGVVTDGMLTDFQQGVLNPLGVNCLRTFPSIGTVVFGARCTTTANPALQQWRYVSVRRMALFIEQSLYAALGWAVFEPNDTPLWNALKATINAFMLGLFQQKAFQGSTANEAFQVVCDQTTTTQADINNGIVNILVAFAPLNPAEFVVIQIAQLAGQAQS